MKRILSQSRNLALAAALVALTACGDRNAPKSTSGAGTGNAADQATPLEQSLARWRSGDQAGAVQRFLEIEWKPGEPAFAPGSPLSAREADLPNLPAAKRDPLVGEAMAQLRDLKQLATAVRDQATAALATDPAKARRCLAALEACGAALDQPEALKILQLTAQAIRKMGAAANLAPGR